MMIETISVLFYEDRINPMDCDVFGVFKERKDATYWLRTHGWWFDTQNCRWLNEKYRGFIEIVKKELQ